MNRARSSATILAGCLALASGAWVLLEAGRPASAAGAVDALRECAAGSATPLSLETRLASPVLSDPTEALPQSHRHVRRHLAELRRWELRCDASSAVEGDPSLNKAATWAAAGCGAELPEDFFSTPPFMHPSGRSYVALMHARRPQSRAWRREHARVAHLLEWADLLEPGDVPRATLELDAHALDTLSRPGALALTPNYVLSRTPSRTPARSVEFEARDRQTWERCIESAGWTVAEPGAACTARRGDVCLAPVRPPLSLGMLGIGLGALLLIGVAWQLTRQVRRERRRGIEGKVLALRTLSHEMRTPLTSLVLDLEQLRGAFDTLDERGQAAVLGMIESTEGMRTTLEVAAEYVAAEGAGRERTRTTLAAILEPVVESVDAPLEVHIVDDRPFSADVRWWRICIRNLVENALVHGEPPYRIDARRTRTHATVAVRDGGTLNPDQLATLVQPHHSSRGSLGLGLAIVERAAQALGGDVRLTSPPTCFTLTLPVDDDPAAPG